LASALDESAKRGETVQLFGGAPVCVHGSIQAPIHCQAVIRDLARAICGAISRNPTDSSPAKPTGEGGRCPLTSKPTDSSPPNRLAEVSAAVGPTKPTDSSPPNRLAEVGATCCGQRPGTGLVIDLAT
jgi:hypothetical protein